MRKCNSQKNLGLYSLGFVYYYYACITIFVCCIIILLATKACATYLNHHSNWVYRRELHYYLAKQCNIRVLPDRRTMSEKDLAMSPSHM